jgi:hypothetical protein
VRAHARALRDRAAHTTADRVNATKPRSTRGMSLADAERMLDIDSARLRPSPAVRASISSDGLVLLDIRGGILLASNPIGACIWRLVEQQQTVAEIVSQLVAHYHVQATLVERDVAAFLNALAQRGLVTLERQC